MFAIGSRWMFEQDTTVLKVIGIVNINNIPYIDNQIYCQMISKMVKVILEAEKHKGIVLETPPKMPQYGSKTLVVCSSIFFSTESSLNAFINVCPQILGQG